MAKVVHSHGARAHVALQSLRTRGKSRLACGTALAGVTFGALFLAPGLALAADECGTATSGSVTCSAGNNPYAGGITYTPAGDLTVNTDPDVVVSGPVSITGEGNNQFVNAGTVANVTAYATAVTVTGDAGATVNSTGALSSTANGANVVRATSDNDVNVTTGTVTNTGASGRGIGAYSRNGDVTITTTGVTSTAGTGAVGIIANGRNVTVNTAGVTTTGTPMSFFDGPSQAINISASEAANVNINGAISTLGDGGIGVTAFGGDVTIVNNASITTAGDRAFGLNLSGENVTTLGAGSISTAGDLATGVLAAGQNLNIQVANVTTTGGSARGVFAQGQNAAVVVTGAVSTSGGQATVNGYYGPTLGVTSSGVVVNATDGVGSVTNSGSITTTGDGARGIDVTGTDGVTVNNSGTVSTSGANADAILAYADQGATVTVANTGRLTTSGAGSAGIYAVGDAVTISGNGSVNTSGAGSDAVVGYASAGPVSITTGAITTSGANSIGINADSVGGTVNVTAASVRVTGAGSRGIYATGEQAVNVTSGAASAFNAPAIEAVSSGGAASVTLNGATTTGNGPAVLVSGTTANLTLGSSGSLASGTGGARLTSTAGSTVNNGGTITGNASGPILTAVGGPLQLTNTGTFTGTVGFTGGNDVLVNNGTYRALFNQDFGAGADRLTNTGTFLVLPGTTTAGTVALTGLETFNNSGLVDLRNGHAGDVLSTSGTFNGTGGSTLGLDISINGASSLADRLTVGGAITGSTQLQLNLNGTNAALTSGLVFASGGAGTSATAFTSTQNTFNIGLVRYDVAFNAANNTFALVGTPGNTVFRTLRLNEAAQQLWYRSADAVAAHLSELRDAKFGGYDADGGRLWLQMYGQTTKRDGGGSFTSFNQTRAVDLSYKQDTFGGQIGLGIGAGGDGAIAFGVTGGYQSSDVSFAGSADGARFDAVNAGAYASFQTGTIFANVLGKYDYYWIDANSPSSGLGDKLHGKSYGVQGELGIRIGGESFYAEPVATLAYVRTDLNDLRSQGATIDFDRFDGLRGKAGLRIGSKMDLGNGATAVIYAQGNYVHEFKGDDGLTFDTGGDGLAFRNRALGDYGQGKIGVSIGSAGGVSGFVEGFGNLGGNYKGGGGRGGLRIKF
jgi:outer membrane autotransporter protein